MNNQDDQQQTAGAPDEPMNVLTRRSFLSGPGVALAATGLMAPTLLRAQAGPPAEKISPASQPAPADHVTEEPPIPARVAPPAKTQYHCDVLVIGGGFAGLMAAVAAREAGQTVVLIDKGRPGFSGLSPWASSHRWFDPEMGDDADAVREQMMRGSQYIGNLNWTNIWIQESKAAKEKLVELGMLDRYPRALDAGFTEKLNFAGYRESIGEHDRHMRMSKTLAAKDIEVRDFTMVTDVIRQGSRVVGAIGFHVPSGAVIVCHAKAVVMCMGGGVYKPAGWPTSGISHDGIAIGYRLGLPIIGQEFDDFHVSDSDEPANSFYPNAWNYLENMWFTGGDWKKETSRQYGGKIGLANSLQRVNAALGGMEPWDGTRVEMGSHNLAGSKSGRAEDLRTGKLNSPIPKGDAYGCAAGFGMHLTNGIFCGLDDTVGYTGIPGLFVAGDGICGGAIAGAQYTGGRGFTSNFVSVQGRRAGAAAARYATSVSLESIDASVVAAQSEELFAPMRRKKGFSANWALDCLQGVMAPVWTLIIKSGVRMNAALSQIEYMRDKVLPLLQATSTHDLRVCHEMRHKVLQAEMKLRAGLAREESRGAHYREDFPFRDDRNFLCYIAVQKNEQGDMKISKVGIKDEWKGDLKEDFSVRYGNTFFPGEAEALHLKQMPATEAHG